MIAPDRKWVVYRSDTMVVVRELAGGEPIGAVLLVAVALLAAGL